MIVFRLTTLPVASNFAKSFNASFKKTKLKTQKEHFWYKYMYKEMQSNFRRAKQL